MLPKETRFFISFHKNDGYRVLPVLEKIRKEGWKNIVTQQNSDAVSAADLIQKSEIVLVFLSKAYTNDDVLMLEHFGYTSVIERKPFLPLWLDSIQDIQRVYRETLSGLTGGELSEKSQILSALEMLTAKHPGIETETVVQALERFNIDKPFYTPSTPQICEKPCEAYEGEEPYLFISYAHNDAEAVYPVVKELYESGWDLWYDEGIKTTQRYLPVIADHVKRCAVFMLMLTPRCLERPFVMNYELEFALRRGIPVIPVLLREITDIPDYITSEAAALIKAAIKRETVCTAVKKTGFLVNRGHREAVPPDVKANVIYDVCLPPELPGFEIAAAGGGITITKYLGSDMEVVAPGEAVAADGTRFPVVGIRGAFNGYKSLTSITLPESITSIGDHAFYRCRGLVSIKIPEYVTTIGENAFYECERLDSITLPEGVTDIGDAAFSMCKSLTSVTIPGSVTSIGGAAFRQCTSLTSITIPDSVTSIGNDAFSECTSLASIIIPHGVTDIKEGVFLFCQSLTSIIIPDGVTGIGGNAFFICTNLTSVTIPDSVKSIGDNAFSSCPSLVIYCSAGSYAEQYAKNNNLKISIQDISLKKNNHDHANREKTANVRISNKLPFCRETPYALVCCADNDSQEAGGILTELYWEGFSIRYDERANEHTVAGSACILAFFSEHTEQSENTMWLLRLAIKRNKAKIIQVFLDNSSWPKAVRNDLQDRQSINYGQMSLLGFQGKLREALRIFGCSLNHPRGFEVVINENKQITITKFTAKDDFPHIIIPKTFFSPPIEVSEIGKEVFSGCKNLSSITLPEGVTNIGEKAFFFCTNLNSITLPDSVTSIGDGAFSGCTRLTSITLPEGVTSIGDSAFSGCNLTSITLPEGITSIGGGAFKCRELGSISVDANNPAYKDDDGVLFNKTGNILIAYPAGKSGTRYAIPVH
jgi:hypothetical protein